MPIDPISTVDRGDPYNTASTRSPQQSMGSEMFMHLLVTQMRYQDPSSPMDTGQMIQQTTQLAMMERMTELTTTGSESFSLQMRVAAASLVGKEVSYVDANGETVTGIADSVSFAGPVPTIAIGDKNIPLDMIGSVTTPGATVPAPEPTP